MRLSDQIVRIHITRLATQSSKRKFLRIFLSGREGVAELSNRRSQTSQRIEQLRSRLTAAEEIAAGKACVYMTGSFGRCEASEFSDLDLFILGKNNGKKERGGKEGGLLSRLDEICIKADLIEAN